MREQTFCMIKPDGVARGLIDKIEKRILDSKIKIIESRLKNLTFDDAKKLYAIHKTKPFYEGLVKFITSGSVFLMKIEGEDVISGLRTIMGATDPRKAEPGTIRGDLKEENIFNEDGIIKNIIHGSDSKENAEYELSLFF